MEGLKRAEDFFEELYREKPGFQEAWDEVEPEYQLATQIIGLRKKLNITQQELARRMQTSQSAVSRLESGDNVSLKIIKKAAKSLNCKPKIYLEPKGEKTHN